MKKNGHNRPRNYAAEIAFDQEVHALPPSDRPGLLNGLRWLRHAPADPDRSGGSRQPPARTFWELDPTTGEWRLL